jgi:anti-sigma-K factor RskA
MTEHPRDDLAAFALGALDEPERRAIDAHVRDCAACTAEVESFRGALHAYASAAETVTPDLRARIVERARRDNAWTASRDNAWTGRGDNAGRRDNAWTSWLRRPIPAFVPALLVLLLVLSLVGVVQSRGDADRYAAVLADVASGRVVHLDPTNAATDLRGALVIPENGAPYIVLRMPAPPSGRAWEAWVLHGETPIPAGLATSGGVFTITLTAPLAAGDGVAVTQEPASGSAAPTSAPVLVVPRT